MACVNINSKEFKDAVQRLNINSGELELIAHKFINQSEENLDKFPSDQYILEQLSPNTFEASSEQLDLYFKARHDVPMQFNNPDTYKQELDKLKSYYPEEAVKGYQDANGLYNIQVATPKVAGIPMVLNNSMIDSFTRGLQKNNPYHMLFNKLVQSIGKDNINIRMQKESPIGKSGDPSYADYNPATNTITFYTDSILNKKQASKDSDAYTRRYLFKTLTHELLHQLTYSTVNGHALSEAAQAFSDKINTLYNEALQYFNGDKSAHYGLFDVNEFISEAMTNISFQRDLAKIKSKEGNKQKSLWSKLIDAIGDFFKQHLGINISNTMLEDVISSIEDFIDYAKPIEDQTIKDLEEQTELYDEAFEQMQGIVPQSYSELHEALKAFRGDWNRPSYKGFTTGRFENTRGKWRIIVPESFRGTVAEAREVAKDMLASKGATEEMYSLGRDFDRITENGITYTTLRVGFKSDKRDQKNTAKVKDKIKVPKSKMTPEERARQDAIDQLLEVRPDLKDRIENELIDVDYLINNPDEITTLASAFESPNEIKDEYTANELLKLEDENPWGFTEEEFSNLNEVDAEHVFEDVDNLILDKLKDIAGEKVAEHLSYFAYDLTPRNSVVLDLGMSPLQILDGIIDDIHHKYTYIKNKLENIEKQKESFAEDEYNNLIKAQKENSDIIDDLFEHRYDILAATLQAYLELTPNSKLEQILIATQDSPIENASIDKETDISRILSELRDTLKAKDKRNESGQLTIFDDIKIDPIKIKGEEGTFELPYKWGKQSEPTTIVKDLIGGNTQQYDVTIPFSSSEFVSKQAKWRTENPTGIVAYRVNKNTFNTPEAVEQGIIGNPFDWQKYGNEKAGNMFYDWLVTGNNFGEEKANEAFRQAIINKILSSEQGTPILYYKELNRPSHATTIGYLINNKQLLTNTNVDKKASTYQPEEVQAYLTNFTLHSGGAPGADFNAWDQIGREFGLEKANHYYHGQRSPYNAPYGNVEISEEEYNEGRVEVAKAAQRNWGYKYPTMKDSRLARNWVQVKKADAIFAVGTIVKPGERIFPNQKNDTRTAVAPSVTGGTGYAVGMAILHDKPVYVFDQNTEQWYTWDSEVGDFIETDTPVLTENFAGIGTREINDAGRKAIRDVYAKTTQALYDEAMSAPFREQLEQDNILKQMEEDFTITRGENGGIQRIEVNKDNILANQVIEHLKSIGIEVHSRDKMEQYLKESNNIQEFTTENGEVYGFVTPEGQMYLDENVINEEHPIHEYTHLWDRAVKNSNLELWMKGVELMQATSLWNEIANSEQYGKKWANQRLSREERSDLIASEVHARLVGRDGAQLLRDLAEEQGKTGIIDKLKKWLTDFWKELKSTFGTWNKADIDKLTLEEFNAMTLRDFAEGTPLKNTTSQLAQREQQRESTAQREVVNTNQDPFLQRTLLITEQVNNLRNSSSLTNSEITEIAEDIVYWISDFITDLQKNTESVLDSLQEAGVNVDHLRGEDFANMARADVVKKLGVRILLDRAKQQFDPERNTENEYYKDYDVKEQMWDVMDNFEGLMEIAQPIFLTTEKFSIKYNDQGLAEINDDLSEGIDATDFNNTNEEEAIKEIEANEAEHWMIESRTRDIMEDMQKAVENALLQCFILDENGNRVKSKRGIDKRVDRRQATNSIVRWTQGALTLSDMITKLQEKQGQHPWLSQLISKLQDQSGEYNDLQSQFFSDFYKPFQLYSVVKYEKGMYKSMPVNEHKALTEATNQIKAQYNTGKHPLFTSEGVNKKTFEDLQEAYDAIKEIISNKDIDWNNEETKKQLAHNLAFAANCLGYYTIPEMVMDSITENNVKVMQDALRWIEKSLSENLDNKSYEPFTFKAKGSIDNNIKQFLRPLTDSLEDVAVSSFFDSGKMYQSYITPSYMAKLMQKFRLTGDSFQQFIENEFKKYDWFYDKNTGEWLNDWVLQLATDEKAKEIFAHKTQLNFNKKNYMKDMDDMEYTMSLISEYFAESENETQSKVPAWFRIPMISNKPSSEFIRFYSYRGITYKDNIADGLKNIFDQELRRIQTVTMRNRAKTDPDFIKNWDTNGKKFNFLTFMNEYLKDNPSKEKEFSSLLKKKIKGETLQPGEEETLYAEAKRIIMEEMEAKAKSTVDNWEAQGILEAAKKITGLGKNPAEIREKLENFVWNDYYAAMNIMELTITDIAFYKNAEDLQKRLAQIHSPGIRGNAEAKLYKSFKDKYGGDKVTDGYTRTFYLRDFEDFKSNIIENVGIVFDKKITEAKQKGNETEAKGLEALKESLVGEDGAYRKINVTDAQGYCSPTAYMKKATIFGKWSEERQRIYDRLKKGEASYAEIKEAFQPLKPFVYSQIEKQVDTMGAPMQNIKMGVQNKNSEYLLILADAITQGYDTGRPNLLRAIYQIMEESHFDKDGKYKADGIDTVQFESTVKTGLTGVVDINKYISLKPFTKASNGELQAKRVMEACIYKTIEEARPTRLEVNKETNEFEQIESAPITRREYNNTFIHAIPVEDYSIQQETPEHFKKHSQAHGSQGRYIIPSELAETDVFGNEVLYNVKNVVTNADGTTEVRNEKVNAKTFKERYERNIAENIQESLDEVRRELNLDPSLSIKDRNIAISKVLQREILSSPRYGVDLLLACSVDENGRFRIPLGDPIQSKRIEQLLTSIIKNRVNKQKIAGGPVVQVSNFGTSRELNIRFKDKNGGLLKTRKEFEGTDEEFKKYIEENQGGIAYFEVFAPIYSDELLKFADGEGNIDIDMIELVNPDLLKMVGYRIPTEAKYSMAPLKIVGFLPREAGEGIMLPNDITLLTGSDFDIDKEYLMRKEFDIAWKYEPKSLKSMSEEELAKLPEAEQDWLRHNKRNIKAEIRKELEKTSPLTKREYNQLERQVNGELQMAISAEDRTHRENIDNINKRFQQLTDAEDYVENSKDPETDEAIHSSRIKNISKERKDAISKENKRHKNNVRRIQSQFAKEKDAKLNKLIKQFEKNKVRKAVDDFFKVDINLPTKLDNSLTRAIRKSYLDKVVKVIEPTSGRSFRNNQIVDMTYEVLTHEQSAAEMLNPGGFEPQKRMGYLIAAYRDPNNTKTWQQLKAMTTDELKDLCQVDKNLMDIDTHIQFYKQNSAAGSLIGIFAVERVAHAVIENEGYRMDVFKACGIDNAFKVMGQVFGGYEKTDPESGISYMVNTKLMEIDVRQNSNGESIGKVLGSLVASAADAVKDPVLNLMNINSQTANILNTLVRLGIPFEDAALFLSSAAVSNVLRTLSRKNLSGFTTFSDVINSRIKEIETTQGITKDSVIHKEELTKDELIKSVREKDMTLSIEYKVLQALKKFKAMGDAMRLPTFATRFNSISNATGPLAVDNLMVEYKMRKLSADSCILNSQDNNSYISIWDIIQNHPILDKFVNSFALAKELLGNQGGITANSNSFRNFLFTLEADEINGDLYDKIMRDRKLLSNLSDFYQSYMLVQSGVIDANELQYYITEFPNEFLKKDYKNKYKDNLLIQSIRFGNDKSDRLTLEVNLTGVDTRDKEKIGDAWSDLYKQDKDLALQLFKYCFFRGGIGFNPKSFMALLPLQMKEAIPNYIDTFRLLPDVVPSYVFDQFIRNNWDSGKLVPSLDSSSDNMQITSIGNGVFRVKMKQNSEQFKLARTPYFKIRVKENGQEVDKLYVIDNIVEGEGKEPPALFFKEIEPLGSNKDYIELSTQHITKATDTTIKVEEEELPPGIQDTEVTEEPPRIYEDVPPPEIPGYTDSIIHQNENEEYYRDLAYKAFLASPSEKVRNSARETVDTWKNKSDREKKSYAKSTKEFFKKMFDKLGIQYDEKLVDKVYDSIC